MTTLRHDRDELFQAFPAWAPAEERVMRRMTTDGASISPAYGRHSVCVEIDPGEYQGRHRSRDFVIPAMVDGVLVRFNPGRAA